MLVSMVVQRVWINRYKIFFNRTVFVLLFPINTHRGLLVATNHMFKSVK